MSATPRWITESAAIAMHESLLAAVRSAPARCDRALLAGILRRPPASHGESASDPFRLAASYALGIARDRPFGADSDAMALLVAGVFLALNAQRLACSEADAASVTRALALGELDAAAYAMFLESACGGG